MFRIALLAAAIALPSLTYAQSADEPPIYERRLFDGFEGTDFAPEGDSTTARISSRAPADTSSRAPSSAPAMVG